MVEEKKSMNTYAHSQATCHATDIADETNNSMFSATSRKCMSLQYSVLEHFTRVLCDENENNAVPYALP